MKILTPEKKIYESEVSSVVVTCQDGPLTILAGHALMTAMLAEGPIIVKTEIETIEGIAGRGVLLVENNSTVIMTHSLKWNNDETSKETFKDFEDADDMMI